MCGIAGVYRKTGDRLPWDALADGLIVGIADRGWDATGLFTIARDGRWNLEKRAVDPVTFVQERGELHGNPRTLLLHTRYPTTGTQTDEDAHPHMFGPIVSVHNGGIFNDWDIWEETGYSRRTGVDSEAIPALVKFLGWNRAKYALALLRGGAALGIVNIREPNSLLLARVESYPLEVFECDEFLVFASTRSAIEVGLRTAFGRRVAKRIASRGSWATVAERSGLIVRPGGIERFNFPEPKPKDSERFGSSWWNVKTTKRPKQCSAVERWETQAWEQERAPILSPDEEWQYSAKDGWTLRDEDAEGAWIEDGANGWLKLDGNGAVLDVSKDDPEERDLPGITIRNAAEFEVWLEGGDRQ